MEHVGCVDKTVEVSPLTNPVMVAAIVGTAAPYRTEGDEAVTVSSALSTVMVDVTVPPDT